MAQYWQSPVFFFIAPSLFLPAMPLRLKPFHFFLIEVSPCSFYHTNTCQYNFDCLKIFFLITSVPDPDPSDPFVFGSPRSGSGSISQRYVSGSFYHQAKIVRKTLIPTVLRLLFDFLSLKNDANYLQKIGNKQKEKNCFVLASWRSMTKIAGSGSASVTKCHWSATLLKTHNYVVFFVCLLLLFCVAQARLQRSVCCRATTGSGTS